LGVGVIVVVAVVVATGVVTGVVVGVISTGAGAITGVSFLYDTKKTPIIMAIMITNMAT
jgi:hypothetical protein